MRFKIDWASLIAERGFAVLALFYFVFEGNFQVQPPAAYIWRGDLTEGFFRYDFGGLIFGILRYSPTGGLACRLRQSPIKGPVIIYRLGGARRILEGIT